jgi:hypothetical protein
MKVAMERKRERIIKWNCVPDYRLLGMVVWQIKC